MNNIDQVIEKLPYKIKELKVSPNSYSSSVFIATTDNDEKIVLKFSYNNDKFKKETYYLDYLSHYIKTPRILTTVSNCIVMTWEDGVNYRDEEVDKLDCKQIYNIGLNLCNIHNVPVTEEDHWIDYLKRRIDESNESLNGVLDKMFLVKVYNYLVSNIKELKYTPCTLHLDYRVGNVIMDKEAVTTIDFESVTIGDYHFDFVKMYRLLSHEQFKLLLDGYKNNREVEDNFYELLDFYNIFDAFCTLDWCIKRNRQDSDFYRDNFKILEKETRKI